MRKVIVLTIIVCLFVANKIVLADNIRGINIDFVTISHAGNGTDPATGNLYGAVDYSYRIGKYEVTNNQWNSFVSAAGVPVGTNKGYELNPRFIGDQQPTTNVSWLEAAQFCNWLTSGDKSKGAYLFSGNNANPGNYLGIDRSSAKIIYGTIYAIPTENEWYKAAYFKPDGSGYSLYANGTDLSPIVTIDANYDWSADCPWNVGSGTMEQNGTWDMMGNIWECNEKRTGPFYGRRGGAYSFTIDGIMSSYRYGQFMYTESDNFGFRIVSIIPEPATLLLLGLGSLFIKRRKIKIQVIVEETK